MKRFGVVGATGLVGREMTRLILERLRPEPSSIVAVASDASAGGVLEVAGRRLVVLPVSEARPGRGDCFLGATSAELAGSWVPSFVAQGAVVIDNSSRFRMDPDVPLVVPEVNAGAVPDGCRLIANPNCSTIQLVAVLRPLLELSGIEWVCVSTYQSVSGAGSQALEELEGQEAGKSATPAGLGYHRNVLTEVGPVDGSSYCEEETKLARETVKILGRSIPVFPSCARVPVRVGHLESVTIRFDRPVSPAAASRALASSGVEVRGLGVAPVAAAGTERVYAGRIRSADERTLQMWVTADNVLKGAALNAFQILEGLLSRGW